MIKFLFFRYSFLFLLFEALKEKDVFEEIARTTVPETNY